MSYELVLPVRVTRKPCNPELGAITWEGGDA